MENIKLTPGTICLLESETTCTNAVTREPGTLLKGTPVRVVSVEPLGCHASCKTNCDRNRTCYAEIVTVEDGRGEKWEIFYFPWAEGEVKQLTPLEDGEADYLLSKEAHKQYKLCEFTGEGISAWLYLVSTVFGALTTTYAVVCVLKNVSDPLGWMLLAASAFVFISGIIEIAAARTYLRNELPETFLSFFDFDNYEENKKALETLLKNPTSTPE